MNFPSSDFLWAHFARDLGVFNTTKLSNRSLSIADLRWFFPLITRERHEHIDYRVCVLDFSFSLLKQMCFLHAPLYPRFFSPQLRFQTSVPQKLDAHGVEQLEVIARAKDAVSRY